MNGRRVRRHRVQWAVAGLGLLAAYAAIAVVAPVGAGMAAAAGTGVSGIFSMQARADAIGLQFVATGFPIVPNGEVAFGSPASAQSSLDSTTSQGFASAPYPGDFVANLPTTVNGLGAGSLPPAPAFPFYLTSSYPTQPSSSQQVGPYVIATNSQQTSSSSDARIGLSTFAPQVVSATAHSSVTRDPQTGNMVAEATSDIAPFTVNGLLSVGEIRASAVLTYDPASGPGVTKQTSVSVGTITVAGMELGLTDKGLVGVGKQLTPVDVSALSALLSSGGASISYVPGTQTTTSVTSSAVELTYKKVLPAPFLDTTVRMILGRVSATANPGSVASLAPTGSVPSGVSLPAGGSGTGLGSGSSLSAANLGTTGSGSSGGTYLGGSPPATVSGTTPAVVGSSPTRLNASPVLIRKETRVASFYLILVVGAALAFAGSRLAQWLSFRARLSPSTS